MANERSQDVLDGMAEALGGWGAIVGCTRLRVESEGEDWEPWQAVEVGGTLQVGRFRLVTDLDFERLETRISFDSAVTYPWPHRVAFIEVTNSSAGCLTDLTSGTAVLTRLHPSLYATARRDLNAHPLRALRIAAADPSASVERVDGKLAVRFTDAESGRVVRCYSGDELIPSRLVYDDHDPVLGDVSLAFHWSDWRTWPGAPSGSPRLPSRTEHRLEGRLIRTERVVRVEAAPIWGPDHFAIPPAVAGGAESGDRIVTGWTQRRRTIGLPYEEYARSERVDMAPLASGVWLARGGTHNSLVVEMADYVVLIEPAFFEERSVAVIDAAMAACPGKPIRFVVPTHAHDDHMGGLRTYAALGATVLAHPANERFFRSVLDQRRTIMPDRLDERRGDGPLEIPFMLVEDEGVLTDGTRRVELHHVPNIHADGMLVPHVADARLLFVSDLVSDTFPLNPAFAQPVHDLVRRKGLSIDMIACGHGNVMPYQQLAFVLEHTALPASDVHAPCCGHGALAQLDRAQALQADSVALGTEPARLKVGAAVRSAALQGVR